MSKQFLRKIILEELSAEKGYNQNRSLTAELNRLARQFADTKGLHFIEVTVEDIEELISYNYVAAFQRSRVATQQRSTLQEEGLNYRSMSTPEKAQLRLGAREKVVNRADNRTLRLQARQVAVFIYKRFVQRYNTQSPTPSLDYKAYQRGPRIEILQPANHFDKVKNVIVSLFEESDVVKESNMLSKFLTNEGNATAKFTRLTQFHHTATTVGEGAAEKLKEAIQNGKMGISQEASNAAVVVVEKILQRVSYDYTLTDNQGKRTVAIKGKPGPQPKNAPGAQDGDWIVLLPRLEKAIYHALIDAGVDKKLASEKASQPFDEKIAKTLINKELLEPAKKIAKVEGGLFEVDPKRRKVKDRQSKQKKQKMPAAGGITLKAQRMAATKRKKSKKRQASNVSLVKIVGVLKRDIQRRVLANMGAPALENRTGRFVGGVQITDASLTPQGHPSIGYTYQKNPYQTFEQGFKQGSKDRDPRRIIDLSIREIASQFAIGRFYTRRV